MEIYDLKLPNGEVLDYVDTKSTDLIDYFSQMGYVLSAIDAFYLAYNDINAREMSQLVGTFNVSVTQDDAVGMLQVESSLGLGATLINYAFKNGTVVDFTPTSFPAFSADFTTARTTILFDRYANDLSILTK